MPATAVRAAEEIAFRSAEELREVLDLVFESVDADERLGPLFRTAHTRARFELTDHVLAVNVASQLDDPDHCLRWSFAKRPPWPPKLTFVMSSGVANAYLQGRESLPVAIARGRIRYSGESRAALLFLPLARLLVKPYTELIETQYPHLLLH